MGTTIVDLNETREATGQPHQDEIRALTNVITSHLPSFHQQALRRLGNAADAEDAVQDALLSAYTHLDQFKGQAQMSTWLTSIVINSSLMKIRTRARKVHIPLDQTDPEEDHHSFSEWLPDHRPNPEERYRKQELVEQLDRLSGRLSPTLRKTFQLREVAGLSLRRAAEVLGVPVGTVKARVARARAHLKQMAEESLVTKRETILRHRE